MYIKVKDLVGENAMTLDDGAAIYNQIHDPLVQGQVVQLDFEGVEVFASPFFNAGVGHLLADLQPDALNNHLKFEHLSDFGIRVLRRVIDNAKEYYAANQSHRNAIDRIVQDNAANG
ncbi:STAS-like domain-containing protein [Methylomicrobium sp. RS1]|uniref:STAS-like domain-containing protein n=1 Tax=Candidatus Methylomicrobium oryzae TaxID=2802053 RepID=UPI001920AC5E|nr:STAS-like domain-containing protein [Methylomicrobium sp. RS1]MBL1265869.1 STAS-like domain-containing protein [Methylomicrobium sp. RS1]